MNIEHLTGRVAPNRDVSRKQQSAGKAADGASFSEILRQKSSLEFSGHALKRLEDRSIKVDNQDMKRLEDAVNRAEEKGSKDSLVMDGNRAFLVNIPNKKVITAVDMMELRDKVFTNIDSTVLTDKNIN